MLENPSISEYLTVTISDCGQSAGNYYTSNVMAPQRLYAKLQKIGEDIVRTLWRHGECGRNLHTA